LLDAAPERHRAMYVGAINTLSGVVALTPVLAGAWIDALSVRGQPALSYVVLFAVVIASVATGLWLSFRLPNLKINSVDSGRMDD